MASERQMAMRKAEIESWCRRMVLLGNGWRGYQRQINELIAIALYATPDDVTQILRATNSYHKGVVRHYLELNGAIA